MRIIFDNFTGMDRMLVRLQVFWPADGTRQLQSVEFGPVGGPYTPIWTAGSTSSPLNINQADWLPGTDTARQIANGTSAVLVLNFDFSVFGSGDYTAGAQWDDTLGLGGNICNSSNVTVPK